MAVVDKYVNSYLEADKKGPAYTTVGANLVAMVATEEIAAADDDTSVYRFFKNVPANLIPLEITVMSDGVTGGNDYDLGLYTPNDGAVIDKDILMDGQDVSSALTRASGHQLGLANVDIAYAELSLGELDVAVNTSNTALPAYDIALTANTVGTAAGTITISALFIVK